MICDKCKDAGGVHRTHFGYVCIPQGSRWLRYWYLCTQCFENFKIATEGKQHPIWDYLLRPKLDKDGNEQFDAKGKLIQELYLKRTDKTVWPEEERNLPGR